MVGPITYVRFHGTSGHYRGSYDTRALERWAARLSEHAAGGRPVYAYLNNDPDAVATQNARALHCNAECRMLNVELMLNSALIQHSAFSIQHA